MAYYFNKASNLLTARICRMQINLATQNIQGGPN